MRSTMFSEFSGTSKGGAKGRRGKGSLAGALGVPSRFMKTGGRFAKARGRAK